MKELAVVIGRFQWFHNGHVHLLEAAAREAKEVLVLIGSADKSPSPKNPFTYAERANVLKTWATNNGVTLETVPINDYSHDDQWVWAVQDAVTQYSTRTMPARGEFLTESDITLVGHYKDDSSYYLHLFPWQLTSVDNPTGISATDFRTEVFWQKGTDYGFEDRLVKHLSHFMDPEEAARRAEACVKDTLDLDKRTEFWARIQNIPDLAFMRLHSPFEMMEFFDEWRGGETWWQIFNDDQAVKSYRLEWGMSPYPPIFVTVDAVVTFRSCVLLIQRRVSPGIGQWALPGGFLNADEWIRDGIIRELREETQIAVPNSDLLRIMSPIHQQDNPGRSLRGRTITHAARFNLDHLGLTDFPAVLGSDDAENASWVPFSEIANLPMFDDHAEIIRKLTGG